MSSNKDWFKFYANPQSPDDTDQEVKTQQDLKVLSLPFVCGKPCAKE